MTTIYAIHIFYKKLIYVKSIPIQNICFMKMNTDFSYFIFLLFFFFSYILEQLLFQNVVTNYYYSKNAITQ